MKLHRGRCAKGETTVGQQGTKGGRLKWAVSKTIGGVSEIAVLSPIRKGCVPNERRTYEERLRSVIDNLADRHRQGVPIDLNRIPAIHFGRLMILRPEQYLLSSFVKDVPYFERTGARGGIPKPLDEFQIMARPSSSPASQPPFEFASFLLTLVEFDGDLRVYMRDIAEYLSGVFDLIFENCEEYPTTADFELFWLWVRRYQINTDLLYAPYPNLSVVRIKQLEAFKQRFDAFVATVRPSQGEPASGLDALFDAFLRENQQIAHDFPNPGGLFRSNQS